MYTQIISNLIWIVNVIAFWEIYNKENWNSKWKYISLAFVLLGIAILAF